MNWIITSSSKSDRRRRKKLDKADIVLDKSRSQQEVYHNPYRILNAINLLISINKTKSFDMSDLDFSFSFYVIFCLVSDLDIIILEQYNISLSCSAYGHSRT